jgi:hypothetical protein
MSKTTEVEEKVAETKKKKSNKKPVTPQNSGVSFALGDRARIKWSRS